MVLVAIIVTLAALFFLNYRQRDLVGTYSGILPCASCAGIKTHLILKDDYSYKLEQDYLGKDNHVITRGIWRTNIKRTSVELNYDLDGVKDSIFFTIGDNYLDLDSNTANYRLNKDTADEGKANTE
jgi:uncharacterized lipoprotein NlpE involved in copper resistance